jgi:large repetitive protein
MTTTHSIRKPRKLAFHSLEERTMMAGDVGVSVLNGDLRITGDAGANDVAVVQTMQNGQLVAGSYFVTGRNGTTINGRATADGLHNTFTGVTRDFNINMGGNDDRVTLGPEANLYGPNNQLKVPRDLVLNVGSGNNNVLLNGLFVTRNASITSGNATDRIFVHASVQNDLTINTGGGADVVDVWNSFARHNLTIDSGVNNTSDVTVYLTTMNIGNDVTITTGAGQDSVFVTEVGVNHDLSIRTGANNDSVSISDSEAADLLFADLGSGNDTLKLTNTYGDRAVLDGGIGFFDSLTENNVTFYSSHVSRNFGVLIPTRR